MSTHPLIDVQNVYFQYDGELILDDVSLRVREGEFVGLIGPNGGGKTTLLKIVAGLLVPQKGSVLVLGQPPREISS